MNQNIDYYNKNAEAFYESSVNADMSEWQNRFLSYVPDGGRILDAGCGSGRDSKAFIKNGYSVVAFDASREMCKRASELIGQEVWQIKFEEMSFDDEFDGVWACASLLHVNKNELMDVLKRIHKALKNQGVLYASFKYGEGSRERGERNFIDFTEESIKPVLRAAGFAVIDTGTTNDIRPGREDERWTNVIAKKYEKNRVILEKMNLNGEEKIIYEELDGKVINPFNTEYLGKPGIWALYGSKKVGEELDCLNVGKCIDIGDEIIHDIGRLNYIPFIENGTHPYFNQFKEDCGFRYIPKHVQEYLYPFIKKHYRHIIFVFVNNKTDGKFEKEYAHKNKAIFWRNGHPYGISNKTNEKKKG